MVWIQKLSYTIRTQKTKNADDYLIIDYIFRMSGIKEMRMVECCGCKELFHVDFVAVPKIVMQIVV